MLGVGFCRAQAACAEAAPARRRRRGARRRSARSRRASSPRSPSGTTTHPSAARSFGDIPDPIYWLFYADGRDDADRRARGSSSMRVRNYERGEPDDRRTTKHNVHRRLARLPRRRVDADAAARPRRRRHALVHLLRVPRAVRGHGHPRDRPPAPRRAQVPARQGLPGVLARSPTSSASCSSSASCGRSPAATSSARTASASRRSPRTRSSSAPSSSSRVTGFVTEAFRIALDGQPVVRAVVVRRLSPRPRSSTAGRPARSPTCTARCGSCTSARSSRSS